MTRSLKTAKDKEQGSPDPLTLLCTGGTLTDMSEDVSNPATGGLTSSSVSSAPVSMTQAGGCRRPGLARRLGLRSRQSKVGKVVLAATAYIVLLAVVGRTSTGGGQGITPAGAGQMDTPGRPANQEMNSEEVEGESQEGELAGPVGARADMTRVLAIHPELEVGDLEDDDSSPSASRINHPSVLNSDEWLPGSPPFQMRRLTGLNRGRESTEYLLGKREHRVREVEEEGEGASSVEDVGAGEEPPSDREEEEAGSKEEAGEETPANEENDRAEIIHTTPPTKEPEATAPPDSGLDVMRGPHNETELCAHPAIEQFPRPLMSQETRASGGLILHIIATVYLFVAIAIICDEFFVPSLEMICDRLEMSEDVAGATFMAAGSSAPELATSIIAVFVAKDDIGISGVIGSAVFNIMFVISVCALFAGSEVNINWWPVVRDCVSYCIAICALLLAIHNEAVRWYEALFLLILYVLYCVMMFYNKRLEAWANTLNIPFKNAGTREEKNSLFGVKSPPVGGDLAKGVDGVNAESDEATEPLLASLNSNLSEETESLELEPDSDGGDLGAGERGLILGDLGVEPRYSRILSHGDDFFLTKGVEQGVEKQGHRERRRTSSCMQDPTTGGRESVVEGEEVAPPPPAVQEVDAAQPRMMAPTMKDEDSTPWQMPLGVCERLYWGITLPLVAIHYVTVPDCRRQGWQRWYLFTFLMSMIWISFYSYFMVWMITIIGFTLNIPDTVMGLTLIAVGVSVPDAISSLCVVKQGYGDMAVSNAIGSNVFDILLCLGLPWFIKTAMTDPGSVVPVESRGLTYSTISLFSTVVFLIAALHLNHWRLDRKLGVALMIWYFLFMLFASLYELNVFGDFNPATCPSNY